MSKKSGVGELTQSLPSGSGATRSIGESFQPNLAMGGGSHKVPLDLPVGPGGFSPKLDLIYNTGYGNGVFGPGWTLSVPFIERARHNPYFAAGQEQFTLAGAERLIPLDGSRYVPFVQPQLQTFERDGEGWRSRALNLVEMSFGSHAGSRVASEVDGRVSVVRWLLDRIIFPGNRIVEFDYEAVGAQRYLRRVRWSVFRVELEYEPRPDPFSQFALGFEVRIDRRCAAISLHNDSLAPATRTRTYRFEYELAAPVGVSLLARIDVTGFRSGSDGATITAKLPALSFAYSGFDPASRRIERFESTCVPPPGLEDDTTLLDYHGTALPGVLQMNGLEATYWENRGRLRWGPPVRLPALPQGVHLRDDRVRFADLTGNGTADLVLAESGGGGYFPHDPERGFLAKRSLGLAPSFALDEPGSWLLDLDGDGIVDLLTFRNGTPLGFFNERGERWRGPVVLPREVLPDLAAGRRRLRFADMNGDGLADLVLLRARSLVYWPSLGNGRFGAPREMADTPDFAVPDADADVLLADLDGDGAADLVLLGKGTIAIHLNRGGEGFAAPILLERTPLLRSGRLVLTDMAGSGTVGFLWTREASAAAPHEYWFLDPLNGVKPYLLTRLDNGAGLTTTIEYTTSAFERTTDLAKGRRWSGYLPFAVNVVKRISIHDAVSGQDSVTEYRYHDGHYDGRAREYLGFAETESRTLATEHEAEIRQRYFFHTRATTARDPEFLAGRGQPHRTELFDPASGELRRIDESTWSARPLDTVEGAGHAYLAVETERVSRRIEAGIEYEREEVAYTHDAVGNITREVRRGEWRDSAETIHVDQLIIESTYAEHTVHGVTSFVSRLRKSDGAGRLLKHVTNYYDGPALDGLPFGVVERGWKTRQREIALTAQACTEAYGPGVPAVLDALYSRENDPVEGLVWARDVRRYRHDALGNQIETQDALGRSTEIQFNADGVLPVAAREDGASWRALEYDPVTQQLARSEDPNGQVTAFEYDALGNILAVYRPGAAADRPTEEYEYRVDTVPNRVIQRIRLDPAASAAGGVKYEYRDGSGRAAQVKRVTEDGRWAVGKQLIHSSAGRELGERDAWFSATPEFEAAAPPELATRALHYDFAGRLDRETLFAGGSTRHEYRRNETRFFGPDRAAQLDTDPLTPPTRSSRANAHGKLVALEEYDADGRHEQRRELDALGRLVALCDPLGHEVLRNVFDLWGNRIRIDAADAGNSRCVHDAANNLIQRTDADGRSVYTPRDSRGRILEVRYGDAQGDLQETCEYDSGPGANLAGRLARVVGKFGTVAYSYSAAGDAVRVTRTFPGDAQTYVVGFEYDAVRNLRVIVYPDGHRVVYTYNPCGTLAAVSGVIESIEYGPTGKRERVAFANGVETRESWTPGDYLLRELVTGAPGGGSTYQDLLFELDGVGQVTRIEDRASVAGKVRNDQTFEYDSRLRLVRATGRGAGGQYDFSYEYDVLGNLVLSKESFAESMHYGHHVGDTQHPNRLIKRRAASSAEYEYDASGNLLRDPAIGRLFYDARHRLERIEKSDGTIIAYRYDHSDRRTETFVTRNGVTTRRLEVEGLYFVEPGTRVKVVMDQERRRALLPDSGDPLLYHWDRLGNVNVVSNLTTGAFVGHDEYTPYGRLSVSILIMPNFTLHGARLHEEVDIVLLGARHYRPALGRFLTPDRYLTVHQDSIPGILAGANLYLYALGNPANITDPTGAIAFLVVLIIAAVIGAVLGTIGAAVNGAKTWDEWVVWIVGGAVGGVLAVLTGAGLAVWLVGCSAATSGAIVALVIWGAASLLGTLLTPVLDKSDSPVAWFFSFLIKWIQSPVTTTIGLIAALIVWIAGGNVDLRRGMLFIEVGSGYGALTLGGVAWTLSDGFNSDGSVKDDLAKHESYHSRQVVALGELGFYVTYLTVGGFLGVIQGGTWIALDSQGCGNPFEKTPWPYDHPGASTKSASECWA
jgi:RHS repeat-associated protein